MPEKFNSSIDITKQKEIKEKQETKSKKKKDLLFFD